MTSLTKTVEDKILTADPIRSWAGLASSKLMTNLWALFWTQSRKTTPDTRPNLLKKLRRTICFSQTFGRYLDSRRIWWGTGVWRRIPLGQTISAATNRMMRVTCVTAVHGIMVKRRHWPTSKLRLRAARAERGEAKSRRMYKKSNILLAILLSKLVCSTQHYRCKCCQHAGQLEIKEQLSGWPFN